MILPLDQIRILAFVVASAESVDEDDIAEALGIPLFDVVQHCYALEALGRIRTTVDARNLDNGYQA